MPGRVIHRRKWCQTYPFPNWTCFVAIIMWHYNSYCPSGDSFYMVKIARIRNKLLYNLVLYTIPTLVLNLKLSHYHCFNVHTMVQCNCYSSEHYPLICLLFKIQRFRDCTDPRTYHHHNGSLPIIMKWKVKWSVQVNDIPLLYIPLLRENFCKICIILNIYCCTKC
jgi:hypothetical protein